MKVAAAAFLLIAVISGLNCLYLAAHGNPSGFAVELMSAILAWGFAVNLLTVIRSRDVTAKSLED